MTSGEAAKKLNVSKDWMFNHQKKLGGRFDHTSRMWLFPDDVVERGEGLKEELGQWHRVVNKCERCKNETVQRQGILSPVYHWYPGCVLCEGSTDWLDGAGMVEEEVQDARADDLATRDRDTP